MWPLESSLSLSSFSLPSPWPELAFLPFFSFYKSWQGADEPLVAFLHRFFSFFLLSLTHPTAISPSCFPSLKNCKLTVHLRSWWRKGVGKHESARTDPKVPNRGETAPQLPKCHPRQRSTRVWGTWRSKSEMPFLATPTTISRCQSIPLDLLVVMVPSVRDKST